jgi:hypothetical protein
VEKKGERNVHVYRIEREGARERERESDRASERAAREMSGNKERERTYWVKGKEASLFFYAATSFPIESNTLLSLHLSLSFSPLSFFLCPHFASLSDAAFPSHSLSLSLSFLSLFGALFLSL